MNRYDIVRKVIDSKAVDFNAIGKIVAEVGPSLALGEEPWEGICGTMRHFIRIYQIAGPNVPVESLGELGSAASQIR